MNKTYVVTGIDTDAGKTVVTGILARNLMLEGKKVITVKFAQTGCEGISEDLLKHREIMGIEPLEEDVNGITCPYVFSVPCSPHLAAEIDGGEISCSVIESNIKKLEEKYDVVLVEGAGGLSVPITRGLLFLDWLERSNYPVILVSTPKLGSINHTLMSLELIHRRAVKLHSLVYNYYADTLPQIEKDTERVIKDYLREYFPETKFVKQGKYEF